MSTVQDKILQTLSERGVMTTKELSKVVYPQKEENKRLYATANRLCGKLHKLEKFGLVYRAGTCKEEGLGGNTSIMWDIVRE